MLYLNAANWVHGRSRQQYPFRKRILAYLLVAHGSASLFSQLLIVGFESCSVEEIQVAFLIPETEYFHYGDCIQ
jgi:hypothetical protein